MAIEARVIAAIDLVTGRLVEVGDADNEAVRVNVVAGGIGLPNYDYVSQAQDVLHDIWSFFKGGSGGTLVSTVTITYTDATKGVIQTVARV